MPCGKHVVGAVPPWLPAQGRPAGLPYNAARVNMSFVRAAAGGELLGAFFWGVPLFWVRKKGVRKKSLRFWMPDRGRKGEHAMRVQRKNHLTEKLRF